MLLCTYLLGGQKLSPSSTPSPARREAEGVLKKKKTPCYFREPNPGAHLMVRTFFTLEPNGKGFFFGLEALFPESSVQLLKCES